MCVYAESETDCRATRDAPARIGPASKVRLPYPYYYFTPQSCPQYTVMMIVLQYAFIHYYVVLFTSTPLVGASGHASAEFVEVSLVAAP